MRIMHEELKNESIYPKSQYTIEEKGLRPYLYFFLSERLNLYNDKAVIDFQLRYAIIALFYSLSSRHAF